MIRTHTARDGTKTYGVRIHRGSGRFEWIGSYPTKKLAREAEARALLERRTTEKLTVDALASLYEALYERTRKASSLSTVRSALRGLRADLGPRPIESIDRATAERWARENGWRVAQASALFNYAVEHGYLDYNPFTGLAERSEGRRDKDPLSEEEVERLAECARAHGSYAQVFAALIRFGAYSGRRPGELYPLEWRDLDLRNSRGLIRRRLYRGKLDTPKSNEPVPFFLLPQARDALAGLPRTSDLVFPSKQERMLTASSISSHYLPPVQALFGRKVTLHELRHFHGHYLYVVKDLPARVVAKQLGHSSPRLVEDLYGHWKHGALDDLERAFGGNVVNLRSTRGAHG